MPLEPTSRSCLAACNRLALKRAALLTQMEAMPPVDQAAVDELFAGAEEALASWGTPPGWDNWGCPPIPRS